MPSEKILNAKKADVQELSDKIKKAQSFVIADYRGITVEEVTNLRNDLRKAKVEYKVIKNTLTRFAAKENGLEELVSYLEGPTAIAISYDDIVAPAKILSEYAKKNDRFKLKAGYVEGKVLNIEEIKQLASIPPKEVLISKLLGSFNAPITGFVNVLNGNIRGLVVALNAIAEKQAAKA
ncbi:MAG: 50S ribosomal protein L10 [Deltaproteobacteria bacterium]